MKKFCLQNQSHVWDQQNNVVKPTFRKKNRKWCRPCRPSWLCLKVNESFSTRFEGQRLKFQIFWPFYDTTRLVQVIECLVVTPSKTVIVMKTFLPLNDPYSYIHLKQQFNSYGFQPFKSYNWRGMHLSRPRVLWLWLWLCVEALSILTTASIYAEAQLAQRQFGWQWQKN